MVWKTEELKKRDGNQENRCVSFGIRLPCERISFRRVPPSSRTTLAATLDTLTTLSKREWSSCFRLKAGMRSSWPPSAVVWPCLNAF
jgi:hypothetical protein